MSVTGFKISNMDLAEKTGTTAAITKDSIIKLKKRAKENTYGPTEIDI